MDNFDLKKYLVENKVTRNSQMLNEAEATSVDKVLDNPKVQKAGEDLAKNPAKLKKALDQAKAAGVDIEALKQAAKAVQAGKPVDNIVRDEVEDLKAEKAKEDKAMEEASGAATGAAVGGVVGAFLTTMMAAATVGAAPVVLPALAIGTLVTALAGAGIGKYADKMGW